MRFQINPSDALPIYRQIMNQVVDAIAGGRLEQGAKLPSHRELAQSLVVAPLTVKKAYDELERAGYLQMKRGQGSFITGGPSLNNQEKIERLRPSTSKLVRDATLLGVKPKALRTLLEQELSTADAGDSSIPQRKAKR